VGALHHMGFILPSMEAVDAWYDWVKKNKVPIARDIKTHRDGARSFYITDPDGNVIQMLYHPPISDQIKS
jgi:catechol 2,3-dioxygenase-like lactoylglutathione lyase family enzyme